MSFNETISIESFQAGVGSAGTSAEKLNGARNQKVHKAIVVKNTHATQKLFVGGSNVSSTLHGYELGQNEEIYLELQNPSEVYVVGDGAGTTYTWCAH